MASIPEIYPKLREALEQFLHDQAEVESKSGESWTSQKLQQTRREAMIRACGFVEKFRTVTRMDLDEEDIVSMEDLAVVCAKSQFWDKDLWQQSVSHTYGYVLSCPYEHSEVKRVAEDLLCLLKPVEEEEEELLPPASPTDQRIWEIFASAKMQHKQFSIVAVYAGFQRSLPETNELVQSMQAKFKSLLSSFQHVQLQMERQGLLGPELQTKMTRFPKRLKSYCQGFATSMMTRWGDQHGKKAFVYTIQLQLDGMTQRWSRLSAEASQIAAQVKELELPEVNSLGSWSLVSRGGRLVEHLEVGSMASGHSVDSQTSCLSGHGGPHCFLPSHLFKVFQPGGEAPVSLVSAQDLQNGAKILSADDASMEVIKVERQKTNKLLELEIDDAVPFTTTPNHRIMVPSDGDEKTVKAVDLKLGSWVLCSDRVAKKVIGKREYLVEDQEVLAITFHPDKAVACFLPPDKPLVLSKGLTRKPIRRSGMNRRVRRRVDGDEVASVPETAAGEYED